MGLTMKEREPIFREFAKEYQKANKKEKGKILDEFVGFTGLKICYSAYLLRDNRNKVFISKKTRLEWDIAKKGRSNAEKKKYGDEVFKVLKKVWLSMNCICSKDLKAGLLKRVEGNSLLEE